MDYIKSVSQLSRKDISKYIGENENRKKNTNYRINGVTYYDSWDVGVDFLFSKETKALNEQLGIHKVNKKNGIRNVMPNYVFVDDNIGVVGFKVFWMRSKDGSSFWCRKAVSLFGCITMTHEQLLKTSPFSIGFNENYVEGKGKTKEEAINNMNVEESQLAESLWF